MADDEAPRRRSANASAPTVAIRGSRSARAAAPIDRTLTSPHLDPRGTSIGPGDRIHRYQLTARLGAGGMGVVYAADDAELHRAVAIKVLHHGHGQAAAERALGEARAMAQFRHANVVPVFDVGVHREQVYLVMPLLEHGTLGDWLRAAPQPWRAAVDKFVLAARGLEAAHAAGLVHRDFKPDNVLLGADDEVRVSDFGLARDGDADPSSPPFAGAPTATQTRLRGTPAYMAPEALDGRAVDARADQFSFCVALHIALCGRRPFAEAEGEAVDLAALREAIRANRVRPAPPDRPVPRWLLAIVARGLRDAPAERWASMTAVVAAIERGLGRGQRRLVRVGSGLAALLVIATIIVSVRADRRDELLVGAPAATSAERGPAAAPPRTEPPTRLTNLGEIDVAEISPDGSQIALYSRGELRVMPSAGGASVLVHKDSRNFTGSHLSWSPDGRRVLLRRGHLENAYYLLVEMAAPHSSIELKQGLIDWAWGSLLPDDEIVSAHQPDKQLYFSSLEPGGPKRSCELPGTYQWITGIRTSGATIYVRVKYPGGHGAWLATDRTCTTPHAICTSDAFPLPGEGCVLLRRNTAIWASGGRFLIEFGQDGRQVGPARRVPDDVTGVVGIGSDGAIVLITLHATWRLVEYPSGREVAAGADEMPLLALAPDGFHLAITSWSTAGIGATRLATVETFDDRSLTIGSGLFHVEWSPDGRKLAARSGSRITVIDVESKARHNLEIDDLATDAAPTWLDNRRVAYPRGDKHAYRWTDIVDSSTGDLLDESQGWTLTLKRSNFDGSLAVFWNRTKGHGSDGVYVIAPDGKTTFVGSPDLHAWARRGRSLWMADKKKIEQYDPRSRTSKRFRTLDFPDSTLLIGLLPTADDRVLLETAEKNVDLTRLAP